MTFLIGLLTVVLVLNCLLLILLVLIQLPKKEAGAGLAFGGAATDALFGAGSGNVLTKVTKYATGVFFLLALSLALIQSQRHGGSTREFERQTEEASRQAATAAPAATPSAETPAPAVAPAASETTPPVLLTPTTNPATPPQP
jgi:preprotein translocase subunit SecG